MIRGLRLIDAVIIAAVALLGLKTLGFFSGVRRPDPAQATTAVNAPMRADDLPKFARSLAYARTNYLQPDLIITVAVPDNDKKDGASTPKQADANVKPVEAGAQPASASEWAFLERLGERRGGLQQKAREIEMRERLIENAEKKLEGRMNELKALEEKVDGAAAKRGDT